MNVQSRRILVMALLVVLGVAPGGGAQTESEAGGGVQTESEAGGGVRTESEAPKPSEVGFVRLINLVPVGEGTTSILIDGANNWPQGFRLGQRTGAIGLRKGDHEFTLSKPGCKAARKVIPVVGGATQTLVAYAEPVRDDSGMIIAWELKVAKLKQHTPDQGMFLTVVSFCDEPEVPLDIHETVSDTRLKTVAKRLGVVRVALQKGQNIAEISHAGEEITSLATDGSGNYVLMLYEDEEGKKGGLTFFDPKFVLAE